MTQKQCDPGAKSRAGVLLGGEHLIHSENSNSTQRFAPNIPPIIMRHWWRQEVHHG